MQYTIVIEKEENTCYGAYVPDFPGAIGVGDSKQEAIESVRESIRLLLEFDLERNEPHADPWMQTETFMGYLVVVADSWEDEDPRRQVAVTRMSPTYPTALAPATLARKPSSEFASRRRLALRKPSATASQSLSPASGSRP